MIVGICDDDLRWLAEAERIVTNYGNENGIDLTAMCSDSINFREVGRIGAGYSAS